MKLYEIANEYRQAFDKLADMELSPELIADSLASIGSEFEDKAKAVVAYIKELEGEIDTISCAVDQLLAREAGKDRKCNVLKDYLLKNMQAVGVERISDPIHPVYIRKNPPKLFIDDEKALKEYFNDSAEFWGIIPPVAEQKFLINSKVKEALAIEASKIKDGLDVGEKIEGAHLGQSVRLNFN